MAKDTIVLYGKNSVFERLQANPGSIKKIFLQEKFDTPKNIEKLIKTNNIAIEQLPFKELSKIKPSKDLQGIVARAKRFEYVTFNNLLNQSKDGQLTLIFLDRVTDPHNLGVIIRTTACFGGFGIVIPKFEACEVDETVLHVASGGENYVPISLVSNLSNAIIAAKKRDFWIMGAVVGSDAENINKISMPFPLGVLLGSEGGGIRHGLQKHLDIKARIPMGGAKLSFNVNMACAIFCHEICRQRTST